MTIKSLDQFLYDKLHLLPLETLRGARLGIDVNHYLLKTLSNKREPLIDAIGGFPSSLRQALLNDFELFKEYEIKPTFVFSGQGLAEQIRHKNSPEVNRTFEQHKQRLWNFHDSAVNNSPLKLPTTSHENFRDSFIVYNYESVFPELIDILYANQIEYIVAPSLSWAQLIYFLQEDFIDTVYGPNELILSTSIEKFITGIEANTQEFRYVDRPKLLNDLAISQTQLLDIAVTVGCDLQPYTLPLFPNVPPARLFDVGLEIVAQGIPIYTLLQSHGEVNIDRFQRGVISLQIIPVLKTNGKVGCINYDETKPVTPDNQPPPSDTHDIIGLRLPHEYYFYESAGLIQPRVLEGILTGQYVEKAPLDGGNDQYKNLVKTLVPDFKNKSLNLLTQPIARFFQTKKIAYTRFFDREEVTLENRMTTPIFSKLTNIVIRAPEERDFDLKKFIDSLASTDLLGPAVNRFSGESEKLNTNYEIIGTALLRQLYLIGFFDFKDSKIISNNLTPSLLALREVSLEHLPSALLLLITLKTKGFNLGNSITNVKPFSKPHEVIARLAGFMQATQSSTQYIGPISKKILSFRSALNSVRAHARDQFESVLISTLTNGEVAKLQRTNVEWRTLASQMTFKETVPSTIFTQVLEAILIDVKAGADIKESKNRIFKHFKDNSNHNLINLEADFERFLDFAANAVKLVEISLKDKGVITEELYVSFKDAAPLLDSLK